MLSTTLRAARPLRTRVPTLAFSNRAQASATRTPPSGRLDQEPFQTTPRRSMATKPPLQPTKIDKEFEQEVAQKKLEPRPDEVTSASSVRQVLESSQAPPKDSPDIMVGIKGDLNTIKDTFALSTVPREAYAVGLAGTLPYLATSLSTVFLSWNLNTQWPTESHLLNSFMFSHESAAQWMHIMEPIQLGYGAVIISFLGAIHWGLEFAERQAAADRTRLRYAIGVLAPAVAWPTMIMPVEWALTTQFAAFCALYFADSRATVKGWAPAWYGTYRFVLTAIVGIAIVLSLVGRAKVGGPEMHTPAAGLKDRIKGKPAWGGQNRNWAKEEEEERQKIKKEKEIEEKKRKQEEEKKAKEEEKKAKEEGKKKPAGKERGANSEKQGGKDEDQEKSRERKEGGATADEDKGRGDKNNKNDET